MQSEFDSIISLDSTTSKSLSVARLLSASSIIMSEEFSDIFANHAFGLLYERPCVMNATSWGLVVVGYKLFFCSN